MTSKFFWNVCRKEYALYRQLEKNQIGKSKQM